MPKTQELPRLVMTDGREWKAVPLADLPDAAWSFYSPHLSEDEQSAQNYWKVVAWLRRAVTLRSDAVASLPFDLIDASGEVYDTTDDWQNKVKFLPRPRHLLWLVEASLTLLGRAYLFREHNRVRTTGLRFVAASTITPKLSEEKGLVGFTRQLKVKQDLEPDDLVYFWLPDPFVELGPGTAPAEAALQAAGVLHSVDKFAAGFFERGAIKATLLTLAAGTPPQERDRLKTWWQRMFSGVDRAWGMELVSDKVEPVVIGEGIDGLSNVALTREKREDIGTALGIPHTLLFADAANYATAAQDDLHFYSKTIVPESEFIAEVLTEQVFQPMGLRMVFRPETLDVFQQDEAERAAAFLAYTQGGLDPWVVGQMLGLELPEGMDWETLRKEKEERREQMQQQLQGKPKPEEEEDDQQQPPPPNPAAVRSALTKWRRAALKRYREGKGAAYEFQSDTLADDVRAVILERLEAANGEEEVKAAFAAPFCGDVWEGYP